MKGGRIEPGEAVIGKLEPGVLPGDEQPRTLTNRG